MKNKSEEIVEIIGKKIVNGEFQELDTIPKMEILADTYQVSRTVIREALKVLSRMGMVESVKKSGTVVLHRSEWHWWDQQILQWVIDSINENNHVNFILHLTEMRLSLEPTAIYLATKRATEEDLEEIKRCILKLEQSIDNPDQWAIADYNFHLSLVKASHNYLMINTLTKLNKALVYSRKKTYGKLNNQKKSNEIDYDSYKKHVEIYEAMVEKNADKAKGIIEGILKKVYELIEKEIMSIEDNKYTNKDGNKSDEAPLGISVKS